MGILSFSIVTTLEGETLVRWHHDANVVYFSGVHAFLCVVAIFIFIVYIIPFPFLVISPRITYKIRFFNKLQPLLDVFWAPFKPKYRWWLSFRLFLRFVSVIVANFVPNPYNILSVSILLVLLHFVQSMIKPFRGYWQNVLDEVLVLNLILLLSGYFYFANFNPIESTNIEGIQVFGAVLVVLAYLLFIVVFVHHMFLRFPKCKLLLISLPSRVNNLLHGRHTYTMEELTIQETDEDPPAVTHFEISISKEEKEEDKQTLTLELQELERLSESAAANTQTKSHAATKSPPRASLKERTVQTKKSRSKISLDKSRGTLEIQGIPLITKDYTEDREPLLAEDDNTYM